MVKIEKKTTTWQIYNKRTRDESIVCVAIVFLWLHSSTMYDV